MNEFKTHYIALWLGCIVGGLSVIPYIFYMGTLPASITIQSFTIAVTIQTAITYGIVLWICSYLIPKTDIKPFVKPNWMLAIIIGIVVGILLFTLNKMVFQNSLFSSLTAPPKWSGLMASLYGGINEEVLMRLFLFTSIYFLLKKVNANRALSFWGANATVALLFGIAHLPAAMKLGPLSTFEVSRILLLNGIAGIAFGWLYFNNGIYAAIIAHFTADIVIHAIL